jgi:hypothetical protein
MPRAWRKRQKYQAKIAREQYRGIRHARRADQAARLNEQLSGQTDHSMPWWREPTIASLIGRARRK